MKALDIALHAAAAALAMATIALTAIMLTGCLHMQQIQGL